MPFDPIRDVESTVDMVEQLRRAHGAVLVTSSQPLQPPNFTAKIGAVTLGSNFTARIF